MFEFKEGDVVRVIDNTGSLEGMDIEIGTKGKVERCSNPNQIIIKIDDKILFVCHDEIELVVRGLK